MKSNRGGASISTASYTKFSRDTSGYLVKVSVECTGRKDTDVAQTLHTACFVNLYMEV